MLSWPTALYTRLHMYIPYQVVFWKDYHFLVELEHKATWAMKRVNLDCTRALE